MVSIILVPLNPTCIRQVYVGEFSEIGFTDQNQMVELDFMSTVLSIDWVYDQTHLIGGTDDDYASIWDVEKMDIVSRY